MSNFKQMFKKYELGYESIKNATKNFDEDNFIGRGGYGMVYRGKFLDYKGQTMGTMGAVKRLFRSPVQADISDISFRTEIKFLDSCKHENIISLLGYCEEGDEKIIVYEYACNGSLDRHLQDPKLTWIRRLKICLGAARGLEYLHDPKGTERRVLHRDIKSGNILLDGNWNAKIADFGLSKFGPANIQDTCLYSVAKGTLGYCDPDYINKNELTKESDVYSFGVVLFEVLCSRVCVNFDYHDERRSLPTLVKKCYQENTLNMFIDPEMKEQMDQNSFDTFVKLAYQCLEDDRTRRPPMALVVRKLAITLKYQEDFENKAYESKRRNRVLQNLLLKDIDDPLLDFDKICPPGGGDSLIVYTTTGSNTIGETYEDCLRIRFLLKDLKVVYQERDVSIHRHYKEELLQILGRQVALPRLFIKGRYIGGAKEVLQLNEQGKFQPLLAEIPQIKSEGPST